MLRDSVVVVVVVVRTRPRTTTLAMITMRKSFMGFLFFPVMTMGLRVAALWPAGAPLLSYKVGGKCDDIPCVVHEVNVTVFHELYMTCFEQGFKRVSR